MTKPSDIRFMYFPDPKCGHRVVTLARRIVGNTMHISWSVNKVAVEEYIEKQECVDKATGREGSYMEYGRFVKVYDKFSKPQARRICRGRMHIERAVILPLDRKVSTPFIQQMIDAIGVPNCRPTLSWLNSSFEEYDEIEMESGDVERVPRLAIPSVVSRVVRDSRANFLAIRRAGRGALTTLPTLLFEN